MDFIENSSEYYNIIAPVVNSYGFSIVEVNSKNRPDGLYINIVLYSPDGISLNDCSKVHRAVQRRIEAHTGNRDIFIEVSSPGINRNIKTANEFNVFKGNTVKVLADDQAEWILYKIKDSDKESVILEPCAKDDEMPQKEAEVKLLYSKIRKAKLET